MREIKKIDKFSFAKVMALIYGLIAFFTALIVAVITIANIIVQKDFAGSIMIVILFNIGAGLILGILTSLIVAIIGWMIGFIIAGVYNWFSKNAGGIKIELGESEDKKDNQLFK